MDSIIAVLGGVTSYFKSSAPSPSPSLREEQTNQAAKSALEMLISRQEKAYNLAIEASVGLPTEEFEAKIKDLQKTHAKEILNQKLSDLINKVKAAEEQLLHTTSSSKDYDDKQMDVAFNASLEREAILEEYALAVFKINKS